MAFEYDLSEYVASTWTMYSLNLIDALDVCTRQGFENVEIWADLVHLDPRANPDVDAVGRRLKANGQKVHSIHLPILHPFVHPADEQEFFKYRLGLQKQTIDWAERLGCGIGVLHAFDPHHYPYTLDQMDLLKERIDGLEKYATARGVRLAIENMPYHPVGNQMVTSLAAQREYFKDLNVYYCLDIGHVPLLGITDCEHEIDAVADRLITFHVHNNHGKKDDHNLPDDGILNWPAIHNHARAAGYDGKFVLEVNERGNGEEILRRCAALGNAQP
jgi:sugar phosphate isomerase/epimerase